MDLTEKLLDNFTKKKKSIMKKKVGHDCSAA